MTIKLSDQGPNIFPLVEGIDVRDAGRTAEVIFATKVEGQLATLTIRLSYAQAATLAGFPGLPIEECRLHSLERVAIHQDWKIQIGATHIASRPRSVAKTQPLCGNCRIPSPWCVCRRPSRLATRRVVGA